jgi:hypothetical protein
MGKRKKKEQTETHEIEMYESFQYIVAPSCVMGMNHLQFSAH